MFSHCFGSQTLFSMEPQLADERQPLLRNTIQDLQSPNTALGEAHNNKQQDSNNGSDPKELSNGQLAVILGSVWVRPEPMTMTIISRVFLDVTRLT